jgi:hypothetical protein
VILAQAGQRDAQALERYAKAQVSALLIAETGRRK